MSEEPPIIHGGGLARSAIVWMVVVLLLLAGSIVVLRLALRRPANVVVRGEVPEGIILTVRDFETNEVGEVQALVMVRNEGNQLLDFGYGVQILGEHGWAHTNGNPTQMQIRTDNDSKLVPQTERLIAVRRPASNHPWRVMAVCWIGADESKPRSKSVQFNSAPIDP